MRITIGMIILVLSLLGLFNQNDSLYKLSAILVGGEYTVHAGEVRQGDMLVVFARVKVAESGQVVGNIKVVGGVIEVAGQVTGDINAYGSEVRLDTPFARVDGTINIIYSLRSLPLVPSLLLVIS